jgi:hypothetical protein
VIRVLDLNGLCGPFIPLSKRIVRARLDEIPHFRSPGGGKLLFREDEVLAWLERYRVRLVDLEAAHKMAEELVGRRKAKWRGGAEGAGR